MTYVNNYKEVNPMPGRDKTGPVNAGPMTGRGLGLCSGVNPAKYSAGLGRGLACRRRLGRGFGRGFAFHEASSKTKKELLQEQREVLQSRLKVIEQQLEVL
jgi:hypothetical protein